MKWWWASCARVGPKSRACASGSPSSGVAVEERIWFNDSTDAAALAEEVADHIARSASGRPNLEATISVSEEK